MGLDMYLSASKYLSDFHKVEKALSDKITKATKNAPGRIKTITAEVGYWRKANAIHRWFVANVQDGRDECQEAEVSTDQLTTLKALCLEVKELARMVPGKLLASTCFSAGNTTQNFEEGMVVENAEEVAALLPSESGFFFGSTDYDEWYIKDVTDTIAICDKALAADADGWSISYRSSW
jgi:hypothetical protein